MLYGKTLSLGCVDIAAGKPAPQKKKEAKSTELILCPQNVPVVNIKHTKTYFP